jgi:hypothetical protein
MCSKTTTTEVSNFEEKSSAVPTTEEIWNKPPLGILKLNVDGAFIAQTDAGSSLNLHSTVVQIGL